MLSSLLRGRALLCKCNEVRLSYWAPFIRRTKVPTLLVELAL